MTKFGAARVEATSTERKTGAEERKTGAEGRKTGAEGAKPTPPPLIVLAHGSRHPNAAPGIERLAQASGELLGVPAYAAHLSFDTPTLPELAAQVEHEHAIVVPLLFTTAYHARVDVPEAAADARRCGTRITVSEPVGAGEDIARVLAAQVPSRARGAVLYAVGSSESQANAMVEELARRVSELSGVPVVVVFATGKGLGDVGERLAQAAAGLPGEATAAHLVPLFVTSGKLLDTALSVAEDLGMSASGPLEVLLADIVAERYRRSVPGRAYSRSPGRGSHNRSVVSPR